MQGDRPLDGPTPKSTESAFDRATQVLSELRREAALHAAHAVDSPGSELTPPPSSEQDRADHAEFARIFESLSTRLTTLEEAIDSLTNRVLQANHNISRGLEANHLARELQSQVDLLVKRVDSLGATVRYLEERVVDVDRMAAHVWDQAAISRRIARLEDVLLPPDIE